MRTDYISSQAPSVRGAIPSEQRSRSRAGPEAFFLEIVAESYNDSNNLDEVPMANIYVERQRDGTYDATQKGRVIARGDTQRQAVDRARRKRPDDPCLAERVRDTERGRRDKWRRVY